MTTSVIERTDAENAAPDGRGRLLAENDALAVRVRRLGVALRGVVGDLAAARRENVALRRENERLRAMLEPPVAYRARRLEGEHRGVVGAGS